MMQNEPTQVPSCSVWKVFEERRRSVGGVWVAFLLRTPMHRVFSVKESFFFCADFKKMWIIATEQTGLCHFFGLFLMADNCSLKAAGNRSFARDRRGGDVFVAKH